MAHLISHGWRIRSLALGSAACAAVALLATAAQAEKKVNATQAAQELVSEALQREVYGLTEERDRLLAEASAKAPQLASAQWARGLMQDGRRGWVAPEEFGTQSGLLERLSKYEFQRSKANESVASQLALANWCQKVGLQEQEKAHLSRVIEQEPDHQEARSRLGFTRTRKGWEKLADLSAARDRDETRQKNLAQWLPRVTEIRRALGNRSQAQRNGAAQNLLAIRDPAVVPAIEQSFLNDVPEVAKPALEALSRIADPDASIALARFAVMGQDPDVRAEAGRRLSKRDLSDFVPPMLTAMFTPTQSQFLLVRTPDGRMVERHAFVREGQDQKDVLVLDTSFVRVSAGGDVRETTSRAMMVATEDVVQRERQLWMQNQMTRQLNERMTETLNAATSQQLAADPAAWWKWWNERNEVQLEGSKPVNSVYNSRQVSIVDRPILAQGGGSSQTAVPQARHECLAAGTPVWTIRGPKAIETIQAGDMVLSQHPDSGELAYKPVLRATTRPRSDLKTIQVAGETWNTTGGHQFWVAGRGWAKASDLQSGDVLHTVRGPLRVSSVEAGPKLETYNLIVDDFHTYFVGAAQALTHDFTTAGPTRSIVPGLIER